MGFSDDQEQKQILSNNLTYLITTTGKDQKEIAIEMDINPPTFNQWVNGKAIPSVSMLKRIAAYFNITLSQLIDAQEQRERTQSEHDKALICAYGKANQSIQEAVDKLLDIKSIYDT